MPTNIVTVVLEAGGRAIFVGRYIHVGIVIDRNIPLRRPHVLKTRLLMILMSKPLTSTHTPPLSSGWDPKRPFEASLSLLLLLPSGFVPCLRHCSGPRWSIA